MEEVIITGAGLSGLCAAYFLKEEGIHALVLEARSRSGGRILTRLASGNNTPVEMGATWFADKHTYLMQLLKELQLPIYKQYQAGTGIIDYGTSAQPEQFTMPETDEPSYRIAGGTSVLTDTLINTIGAQQVVYNCPVHKVKDHQSYIEVSSANGQTFKCKTLIVTIPPYLLHAQNIIFEPALPAHLTTVMQSTHTWMSEAIKFAVEYERPFWREKGSSGTIFSHAGIAQEIYDHTNYAESHFALKGFIYNDAHALPKAEREQRLIKQLIRLLGQEAAHYLSYTEKVWREDEYTHANYSAFVMPHQHNGHPVYSAPFMQNKLYIAGTESSPHYGGYMEGAVYSALAVARKIADHRNTI